MSNRQKPRIEKRIREHSNQTTGPPENPRSGRTNKRVWMPLES